MFYCPYPKPQVPTDGYNPLPQAQDWVIQRQNFNKSPNSLHGKDKRVPYSKGGIEALVGDASACNTQDYLTTE